MFDPTVFDNLKVIVEGAIYDRDLVGELLVTDRKDVVELAKMNRTFKITFQDRNIEGIEASLTLTFDLQNISAELLQTNQIPGCHVEIGFHLEIEIIDTCSRIQEVLTKIWGENRDIQQSISFLYQENVKNYVNTCRIGFDRLVYEDNVDDLIEMIDYMVESIHELKIYKKGLDR